MKKLFIPAAFKISPAQLPDESQFFREVIPPFISIAQGNADSLSNPRSEIDPRVLKCFLTVATNAWSAKKKITDGHSGKVREGMQGVYDRIDAIYRSLNEIGFEIIDHQNNPYDAGEPMEVIAFEPTVGIARDRVKETLSPTIKFKSHVLKHAQIVVAVPQNSNPQQEQTPTP